MNKFSISRTVVRGFSAALLLAIATMQAVAQAPTDEWRRAIDAMVAEPAQAGSILSNPAGIKTNEDREGKKHEWLFELLSGGFFFSEAARKLITDPSGFISRQAFGSLNSLISVASGEKTDDQATLEMFQNLSAADYAEIIQGTSLGGNPRDLTLAQLEALTSTDLATIQANLRRNTGDIVSALANSVLKKFTDAFGNMTLAIYSRALNLSHVNDKKPLAWGLYFGIEEKLFITNKVESLNMPLSLDISGIKFDLELPIGLQIYIVAPLRVAFAHNFDEALPGFTFGLGLKAVPYLGLNQTGLGNYISNVVSTDGSNPASLMDSLLDLSGINLGIDLGVQYHFGSITPKLEFLHTGLKVSDILGFNIPFSKRADTLRYAIDFDWGVYAEQKFLKIFQVLGGFEIIQLRGMFKGGASPYSALFRPIDHLRFLAGIGLWNNALRISVQYYNGTLSPSLQWNPNGVIQLGLALNLRPASSWGIEFSFNFRGPHDGFNNKTPYKTWAQQAAKNRQTWAWAEQEEAGTTANSDDDTENLAENPEASLVQ